MNKKQRDTLAKVFEEPASPSTRWADIENLLIAVGCERREGNGSRVRFRLNDIPLHVHRPHPTPFAKRHLVRKVRAFLEQAGILP